MDDWLALTWTLTIFIDRAMNAGVRRDIVVSDFLNSVGGYRHKERRDHLLDILDIDLDWCVFSTTPVQFLSNVLSILCNLVPILLTLNLNLLPSIDTAHSFLHALTYFSPLFHPPGTCTPFQMANAAASNSVWVSWANGTYSS